MRDVVDVAVFAGDPPMPADGSCASCGGPRYPVPAYSIWSKPGSDRKYEAA